MIEEGEVKPGVRRTCEACGHRDDYPSYWDRCMACEHRFGAPVSLGPDGRYMATWHCGVCNLFYRTDWRLDARCVCGKAGIIGQREKNPDGSDRDSGQAVASGEGWAPF